MNEEPPQIVIRTAEERLAAEAAAIRVSETAWGKGMVFRVERADQETVAPGKSWWFRDREAASAWVCLRARELSSEGIDIYVGEGDAPIPDERITRPLRHLRNGGLEQMLKW